MDSVTIELPDGVKAKIDKHLMGSEFANLSEYMLSLLARDLQLADMDKLLDEADAEFERGEYIAHKKGDIIKMGEEMIRRRLDAKTQ
jgi:Arc/MetJ-type ribon-helix-helix transcriptional regulator